MSITTAISAALSGLRYSQANLSVASANIANAETEGYTRKELDASPRLIGDRIVGVSTGAIQRELDTLLHQQLRSEQGNLAETSAISEYYARLDILFGVPGSENALDTLYNNFTSSLQELSASPESGVHRVSVVNDATVLASQINQLADSVVTMREEIESRLDSAINSVNDLLTNIRIVDTEIQSQTGTGMVSADLLDQRDNYIDQLAQFMDIRVDQKNTGTVSIMTGSGVLLFDHEPAVLDFDAAGSLNPDSVWSPDPAERGVGTIQVVSGAGYGVDLITADAIRSGEIGGLLELRDSALVDIQARLDELAHSMSLALSNTDVASTPVTAGPLTGADIDLTGLQQGNSITLEFDNGGTPQVVTIFRVDDASQLPLDDSASPRTDDTVIGIDFSGGYAAAAAAIDAVLAPAITVSNPAGSTLQFLNDGATTAVTSLTASVTETSLQSGNIGLPLFTSGIGPGNIYTGSFEGGSHKSGYANRISVNPDIISDPASLIIYDNAPQTPLGDASRPSEMFRRLTEDVFSFDPTTRIGSDSHVFSGSIGQFAREVISRTASESATMSTRRTGQEIVVNGLEKRMSETSGVDIDVEIARLTELQNLYAANARVMTIAQEMLDVLMRI